MKTTISILLLLSCQSILSRTINSPIPPVELTSFTGQVEDSCVHLFWTTDSEFNNLGFEIERAIQIGQWQEIGFVEGNGTTNESHTYEFKDSLINVVAEKCYYRLKQIDYDGTFIYSNEIEILLQQITLRDTTNQYDYIIITVPEFVTACEPFRQHKETVRDFRTLIVDTTQIFAEFDSSATPQDNIRDFISYAGTFWKEPQPIYFLIAGTVSDVPNFPILFTFDSLYYNSDYYYSQDIYENDSTTTDFYIGRIPAKNSAELGNYFSKVIEYESNNILHSWMNNNLFLCENDPQFGFLEAAISIAEDYLPEIIRSFYIYDDSNSIYYGDKDSIYKAINERGNAIVWFYGHCSDSAFISPEYFNINDLIGLNNQAMYFLSIYVSTQHSIIDSNTNMAAKMMMMSNSGSIGSIVPVGPSFWGVGNEMRREWAERLFDHSIESLGEAFVLDSLGSVSFFGYMKKITNLWADPSLKLKYDTTVGVEQVAIETPQNFILEQNYPNPFNPTTTIKFALPIDSKVKINVYNSLGQLVETLVDKEMESGYHEVNFNASRLSQRCLFVSAAGRRLYFCKEDDFA